MPCAAHGFDRGGDLRHYPVEMASRVRVWGPRFAMCCRKKLGVGTVRTEITIVVDGLLIRN